MTRIIIILLILGAVHSEEICKKAVDIAMVVDESGSIGIDNFNIIKDFLVSVVAKFSVAEYGAKFALVKYSTDAQLVFGLDKYTSKVELQHTIQNIGYRQGSTQTGLALEFTRQNVFNQSANRRYVPDVVILFTDGKSHDHQSRAMRQAHLLKDEGVEVLCVGIGEGKIEAGLRAQLKDLVSKPYFLHETVYTLLETIATSLVTEICEAIDICNTKPPCPLVNQQCVPDALNGSAYDCVCKVGYSGVNCDHEDFIAHGCRQTSSQGGDRQTNFIHRPIQLFQWGPGWDDFLDEIIGFCFRMTRDRKLHYFWIEFFAECYALADVDLDDLPRRPIGTDRCWTKRPDFEHCNVDEKLPMCTGHSNHGFIYEVIYD